MFFKIEIGKMQFSNQANFTLAVPDSAYVSAFSVEVGGRLFEARIEPSDEGAEYIWWFIGIFWNLEKKSREKVKFCLAEFFLKF